MNRSGSVPRAGALDSARVPDAEHDSRQSSEGSGKIDIYSILFNTDKTDIKPQSQSTLNEIAKLRKSDPSLKLEINGHTDSAGTAQHNMTLSKGRADSVAQTLVKQYGISASQPTGERLWGYEASCAQRHRRNSREEPARRAAQTLIAAESGQENEEEVQQP